MWPSDWREALSTLAADPSQKLQLHQAESAPKLNARLRMAEALRYSIAFFNGWDPEVVALCATHTLRFEREPVDGRWRLVMLAQRKPIRPG